MAAHRYWRIFVLSNVYGSYAGMAEVSMATSVGGANACTGGTPSASTSFSASYAPAMALDLNPSTYWGSSGGAANEWWEYDFVTAVNVVEVKITARNDTAPTTAPGQWKLQASDDNITWTDVASFTSAAWTTGSQQTFDVFPTLDGFVSAGATTSFAATSPLTTTKTNDIIVAVIFNEYTTAQTVTSITGGGLTWAKHGAFTGIDPGRGAGHYTSIEVWWAAATAVQSAVSFTINMSGTFDDGAYVIFGVNGAASLTAPFDTNASLPATGNGGTLTYSTTQTADFVFSAFASSFSGNPGATPPTGFNLIAHTGTNAGINFSDLAVSYQAVATAQTNASVVSPGTAAQLTGILAAITGAGSSAPAATTRAQVAQTLTEVVAAPASPNTAAVQSLTEVIAYNPAPTVFGSQVFMEVICGPSFNVLTWDGKRLDGTRGG